MIANQGGTLDLFRDPGSGGVRQAVWPGGEPTTAPRPDEIPSGATIADRSGSDAGSTSDGREIPGVRVAGSAGSTGAGGPLSFRVVGEPAHGALALAPGGGLRADTTYTPAPGFAGEDSFTYVATDARGLTSSPATVRVSVAAAAAGTASPPPAIAPRARLTAVRVVKRRGRWRVVLRSSAPARLSGRLERHVRGRRTTYRLRSRRVAAGPARMALGRLVPARYRLRLYVDGRRAANATFTVRRPRRF